MAVALDLRINNSLLQPDLYLGRAYLKNGFMKRLITGEEFGFVLWLALQEI